MGGLYSLGPQWTLLPPTAVTRATSWLENRHEPVSMMDNGLGRSLSVNVRGMYTQVKQLFALHVSFSLCDFFVL